MDLIIKHYLGPVYKFIIEFFNINKFKSYKYFVKFMWYADEKPEIIMNLITIVVLQFVAWHWIFKFSLLDDIICIILAHLLYRGFTSLLKIFK